MIDKVDIFVLIMMVFAATTLLLGSIVLSRGGWYYIGQEHPRPTRLQKIFSMCMFFLFLTFLPYAYILFFADNPPVLWLCLSYVMDIASLGLLPLLAQALRQQSIGFWDCVRYFSPVLPLFLATFTIYDAHPYAYRILIYATMLYMAGAHLYSLYQLHLWDRSLRDVYSDIAHKETV